MSPSRRARPRLAVARGPVGLLQPRTTAHLGLVAVSFHAGGHSGDHRPQGLSRPPHRMIVAERAGRVLGGRHRRPGSAIGQGRRRPAGLQPQADLQREDRRLDGVDVLVEHPQRVIVPKRVATERLGVLERRRYQVPPDSIWPGMSLRSCGSRWLKVHSTMIRPSSRSDPASRSRSDGRPGAWGRPGRTRRWATESVITGTRRAVNGSKDVAKCVASRSREDVAWSIEAAFPVVGTERVRHCHFTGEAPQRSRDPPPEVADSSRVKDENQRKSAENPGTRAIAPSVPVASPSSATRRMPVNVGRPAGPII